jgi:hypothetical protein
VKDCESDAGRAERSSRAQPKSAIPVGVNKARTSASEVKAEVTEIVDPEGWVRASKKLPCGPHMMTWRATTWE